MIDNYIIESVDYLLPPDIEIYKYEIYYNEEEVWRDVYFIENGIEYDYRGLYQVSNYGRVKSLGKNGNEKIRLLYTGKQGYKSIDLWKNGKRKNFFVHRLIAHMFIEGYFENAQVNHKDENKENNHLSNLEWCDSKYNNNYGTKKIYFKK